MSGKAGSIGSIVVGAIVIIAGFFTYGATWAALPTVLGGAMAIAGGAIGLAFQPKSLSQESAKAQDLQFANSSEGYPVPVIFGEQKVVPNFMNYRADQLRSVEGVVAVGGKGGGGTTQPNGIIDYYLSFELGLCMGPIDEVGQVISVPGDTLCRGSQYSIGNGVTASQSGLTVTASSIFAGFTSSMVGGTLVWADGSTDIVTSVLSAYVLRVSSSRTVTSQRLKIFSRIDYVDFEELAEDYADLTLSGVNEGGLIRIYKGAHDQNRIEALDPYYSSGMNYRNLAYAVFLDFWIARGSPTPKTYQFIVRRLPKCIRDNGTIVTDIQTRGSIDPTHPAYYQANPAAIIYELFTNKLWALGKSSDEFDEDSFAECSRYFAAKNIGISMTLDSPEKIGTLLDGIRLQLKTIVTWSGGKYKMRCLMDVNQTSAAMLTFTAADVEEFTVMRPMWTAAVNDVRAEFNSREKLYKPDIIQLQNQANIDMTGRINSRALTLRSVTDWNIAMRQLARMLAEYSYPAASASFLVNRFNSRIEIGDVCRIIWKEFDTTVTAYFMVTKIQPMGKNDERLRISAVEDVFLCPVSGEETSVTLPQEQGWEKLVELTPSDLSKFEPPTAKEGAIDPITAVEMPPFFEIGKCWLSVFGVRPAPAVTSAQVYYAPELSNNFLPLTGNLDFAIACYLTTTIAHDRPTDRSASFVEFTADVAELATLTAVNLIQSENDDLEAVDNATTNFLIIGEEIIKVGRIVNVSGNVFRATHVVRGVFGSPVYPHASGEIGFFRQTISQGFDIVTNNIAEGVAKLKAYPVSPAGPNEIGEQFYPVKNNSDTQTITRQALRPLGVEMNDVQGYTSGGTSYAVFRFRFKYSDAGAGSRPFLGQYNAATNTVNGVILDTHIDYNVRFVSAIALNGPTFRNVSPTWSSNMEAILTYSMTDGGFDWATINATGYNAAFAFNALNVSKRTCYQLARL